MKRLFFWATIASGAIAAYMMLRRGESIPKTAARTLTNPVGSFVNELRTS
jgi:hypothetical protein